MSYRIEPNDNLDSVLDYTTHLNRFIFDAVERQAGNTTTTSRPNNTNTTTTTTIATTLKTTITTRRPNITATTSVINFTTTSLAPILTTTPSTNGNCQRDELAWIKLVLLVAILVCLIILVVTVCVTVCYYISSMPNMPIPADIEQRRTSASSSPGGQLMSITPQQQQQPPPTPPPIPPPTPTSTPRSPLQSTPTPMGSASSGKIEPKSGRMDAPDTAASISITATTPTTSNAFANYSSSTNTSPYGLKRLSATPERPRRPLASSSNNSTFSIHMAPPSPRSLSIGPGMDAPEETVVKKMALDRIEQEEAKRHQDLALLAEKSSSLAKLGEQLKAEAATAKAATKDATTAAAKAGGSVQTPSMPYKSTASKSNKQLKPHESSSGKLVKPVSKEKKKKKKSKEKLGKPKDSSKERPGKPKDTSNEKLGKSKDSSKEMKAKSRDSAGKVIGPGLIGSRSPSKPLESIKSATSKQPSFTIDPKTNKLVLEPNVEDDRFSAR